MKKLLMFIPLVFLLCFTFGCQDKEVMVELEEFRAQAAVEEQNIAIVERVDNLFNLEKEKMLALIDETHTPDTIGHYGMSATLEGTEPLKKNLELFLDAFSDFDSKTEVIFAHKDYVVIRTRMSYTQKGEWMGISQPGKRITMTDISIYRFENGKIKESWGEFNSLETAMQGGFELKPKEEK